MIQKGSLIRRLAQDRREKSENAAGNSDFAVAIPVDGLLKEEKPAPPPMAKPAAPIVAPSPVPAVESHAHDRVVVGSPSSPFSGNLEGGQGTPSVKPAPAPAKPPAEKQAETPRLSRLPGRQRGRQSDVCPRHPGEAKRNAGARAWLTPEESEKLELLATAYQISTSTLTRDLILEGLAAHADMIEKTRKFLDSLGKGRVGA